MAITTEEKRLAISLYEKYCDVFDAIFDTLQEAEAIDYSTSDIPRRGKKIGKLVVKIDKTIFEGKSINDLFLKVLEYLVAQNKFDNIDLPWRTGNSRYIISNEKEPIHPNGRKFFVPVQYKDYSMETHVDRKRGIKILDSLCNQLNLKFETILD